MKLEKKIYPSVSDYIEAMANPEGRFRTLDGLSPVTDRDGVPLYTAASGGRVCFDVQATDGERVKLICFTSVVPERFRREDLLHDEIYVFNRIGEGDYYPVWLQRDEADDGESETEECGELKEERRIVVRGGLFGYADAAGNVIVRPQYQWAGDFEEGRAVVCSPEGYYGLIDRDGVQVILPEYDDLSWDNSRYAYVDQGGKFGCLDRSGEVVVPIEYDWMGEFSYGFAVVARDGKYGYVNRSGEVVSPGLVYDDALSAGEEGWADVVENGASRRIKLL